VDTRLASLLATQPALEGQDVRVAPLSGGITNHNFRVDVDGRSYVLRLGGENTSLLGVDRAREYDCTYAAMEAGVGAEVIAFIPQDDAMITEFVPGHGLEEADVRRPEVLQRIAEALGRLHAAPPIPGTFSPFAVVRAYSALARERDVPFPDSMGEALAALRQIEADLESNDAPCPCHNDLLCGNLIDDGTRVRIIDWEYAGMGDRFFDLGNLAVNNEFEEEHERMLLEFTFGEVRPDHLRRLRLMRLASDMRESLWGFLQAGISTLDVDFLAYAHTHLERFLEGTRVLHEYPVPGSRP
jgi:thiamine kinase-like enzyme